MLNAFNVSYIPYVVSTIIIPSTFKEDLSSGYYINIGENSQKSLFAIPHIKKDCKHSFRAL